MNDHWRDLLRALKLLAEHGDENSHPFHCEHDILTVMSDPGKFTEAELELLEELGFRPDVEYGECFISYRFGSA